ncbi:MAG: HTH DNA binding domain protein [Promethearchaeota archaeon]|nr:MAG: HTH DNA binding domain protein [Candidatus Lokiarchaeota archaeon]
MKIIRLQVPGIFLKFVGFAELFNDLEWVKILKAFQYDQNQFFSLQRIKFKPNAMEDLSKEIKAKFNPETIQILNIQGDEVLCIMYQSNKTGFFPVIQSGPWAFLFPIHASRDVCLVNIISLETYVPTLLQTLSKFTPDYELIAIQDINELDNINQILAQYSLPYPNFSKRQTEIASFAAKHGYFNNPKEISAQKIADKFKISISAVNKHLRRAENTAMKYFFGTFS